jgi:hypothetical protein
MAARTPGQGVHGHNVRRDGFGWRRRLGDLLAKLFRQILIYVTKIFQTKGVGARVAELLRRPCRKTRSHFLKI